MHQGIYARILLRSLDSSALSLSLSLSLSLEELTNKQRKHFTYRAHCESYVLLETSSILFAGMIKSQIKIIKTSLGFSISSDSDQTQITESMCDNK